jgi:hypothetical protein
LLPYGENSAACESYKKFPGCWLAILSRSAILRTPQRMALRGLSACCSLKILALLFLP